MRRSSLLTPAPTPAPEPHYSRGQGLAGVRERAALAGGRADAGPNESGGWTVAALFPLAAQEA